MTLLIFFIVCIFVCFIASLEYFRLINKRANYFFSNSFLNKLDLIATTNMANENLQ